MDTMVKTTRLLRLSEMESIAKNAIYAALVGHVPPSDEDKAIMTLGKMVTDTEGVFELYIPSVRPQDAKVICCAKVSRLTGEVNVDVFLQTANKIC